MNYYDEKVNECKESIKKVSGLLKEISDYAARHDISAYEVADELGLRIDQFNELRRIYD